MQYLTKTFHSKVRTQDCIAEPKIDAKGCIKKLNKWLAKSGQQDVKVDDISYFLLWLSASDYLTKLVITYHHVKFHYPPNV